MENSIPETENIRKKQRWITPLLCALAILLAFVFLGARIYESAQDSHTFC